MSDLESFRAYCHHMTTAEHSPTCVRRRPPKPCDGCVSDADRRLWRQLADEVDAYLTADDGQDALC